MQDRLWGWYTSVKNYTLATISAIRHPIQTIKSLAAYISSSQRYKNAKYYAIITKDGVLETGNQLIAGVQYSLAPPYGEFNRVLLVEKEPTEADFKIPNTLLLFRKNGLLTVYWIEEIDNSGLFLDGTANTPASLPKLTREICKNSFKEEEVKDIISRLPAKFNKESFDPFLLHAIKAKYGFNPRITEMIQDTLIETWQGFSRVLDPSNITKLVKRPETRRVLYYSISANLWYFVSAMFYEQTVKGTLRYIPGMENSYSEAALDLAAYYYLFSQAANLVIENSFYNTVVAKVSGQEEPACEHFGPCGCSTGKQLKGMLGSSFYLMADQLSIKLLTNSLPMFGSEIKFGLNALRFGQAFLEYKLAAKGMCTQHRYQLLTKNNNYAFGFGLSYLVLCNAITIYIKRTCGVNSAFIEDATFSGLFPLYIFLAQTIDKPLPGKGSVDVFYLSRYATSSTLSASTKWLGQYLSNPKNEATIRRLKAALMRFPPFQLFCFLVTTEGKLQKIDETLASLCQRESIELYLEYSTDDIKDLINSIKAIRESFIYNNVNYYFSYLLAADTKKLLSVLLNDKLGEILETIESVLNHAESKASAHIYTTNFERLSEQLKLKELLNRLRSLLGFEELASQNLIANVREEYPADNKEPIDKNTKTEKNNPVVINRAILSKAPLAITVIEHEKSSHAVSKTEEEGLSVEAGIDKHVSETTTPTVTTVTQAASSNAATVVAELSEASAKPAEQAVVVAMANPDLPPQIVLLNVIEEYTAANQASPDPSQNDNATRKVSHSTSSGAILQTLNDANVKLTQKQKGKHSVLKPGALAQDREVPIAPGARLTRRNIFISQPESPFGVALGPTHHPKKKQ